MEKCLPITVLVSTPIAMVGSVKLGFDTLEKFIAAVRAAPDKYHWGSTENTTRLTGELFRLQSGLKIDNVAYKGAAPMMQELLGGHIPVGFTSPLTAMSQHRAGAIRILALASDRRLPAIPEVPTMKEGGVEGLDRSGWWSLFGPKKLPPALAHRIRDDVAAVLSEPELKARIVDMAGKAGGEPVEAFAARVNADLAMWRNTVKAAGIQPE